MKKVCFFTGTRAEYGLLKWLMKDMSQDPDFQVDIVVSGTHLSSLFGETYKEIETDGFKISYKIPILNGDTSIPGTAQAMGLAIEGVARVLNDLKPDILVLLGDRYEALAAAIAATLTHTPIAHIHGGEITEGAIDDVFRHSITKMSHLHFTALPEYQKRVIQMGEDPSTVFCVGGLGVDAIKRIELMSKEEFEQSIGMKLGKINFLITLHPTTLDSSITTEQAVHNLLEVLDSFKDACFVFTGANADPDGMIVNDMFKNYVKNNHERSVYFDSLGQRRYFSALALVDAVIGNSSSGLLEAPSFQIPTVNIGDRQKGRIRPQSVIDSQWSVDVLKESIDLALSFKFKNQNKAFTNPYEQGDASMLIAKYLGQISSVNLNKKFYDIGSACG